MGVVLGTLTKFVLPELKKPGNVFHKEKVMTKLSPFVCKKGFSNFNKEKDVNHERNRNKSLTRQR